MTSGIQTVVFNRRVTACRAFLGLFVALFLVGFATAPASAPMHRASVAVVSSSVDDHSDCDRGQAGVAGHCCNLTAGCFAYAQIAPASITFEAPVADHDLANSQLHVATRSPPPNLRPPKRSIQV